MKSRLLYSFFFNDTATTEIYTLSLHERSSDLAHDGSRPGSAPRTAAALPTLTAGRQDPDVEPLTFEEVLWVSDRDRKSTRLNSSHPSISYAVFCLKKKKDPGGDPHHHHCHITL